MPQADTGGGGGVTRGGVEETRFHPVSTDMPPGASLRRDTVGARTLPIRRIRGDGPAGEYRFGASGCRVVDPACWRAAKTRGRGKRMMNVAPDSYLPLTRSLVAVIPWMVAELVHPVGGPTGNPV